MAAQDRYYADAGGGCRLHVRLILYITQLFSLR